MREPVRSNSGEKGKEDIPSRGNCMSKGPEAGGVLYQ